MTFQFAARTNVGLKRENNEDNFVVIPEDGLFAVCDGMGGYSAGEVASKLACDEVKQFFELNGRDKDATWPFKPDKAHTFDENRIAVAVKLANQSVFDHAQSDPRCRSMGTTFVGLLYSQGNNVVIAHAGDSRAYAFSDGKLRRLTHDHSLVEEFVRLGRLTPEQAKNFPQKNVILRALGQQRTLDVEVHTYPLDPDDVLLLCSDGLSGMIEDEEMLAILQAKLPNLDETADAMIEAALKAGGLDNVTCVLCRREPQPDVKQPAPALLQ